MKGIFLFVFFLIYFGIIFILRSYVAWKNTGINPITFDKKDDAHGFNGKLFAFIIGIECIIISLYAFVESCHPYLLPIWYLESEIFQWFGWILLFASLVWVVIAQFQMADSWRIGIDEKHKTDLITQGLFSISRNPIFLGIIFANIGLLLVLPNAFTLLIAVLSNVVIQTQVRLEESFLRATMGSAYQEYFDLVRRWL